MARSVPATRTLHRGFRGEFEVARGRLQFLAGERLETVGELVGGAGDRGAAAGDRVRAAGAGAGRHQIGIALDDAHEIGREARRWAISCA